MCPIEQHGSRRLSCIHNTVSPPKQLSHMNCRQCPESPFNSRSTRREMVSDVFSPTGNNPFGFRWAAEAGWRVGGKKYTVLVPDRNGSAHSLSVLRTGTCSIYTCSMRQWAAVTSTGLCLHRGHLLPLKGLLMFHQPRPEHSQPNPFHLLCKLRSRHRDPFIP